MKRSDGLYPYFIDPSTGLKDFWATNSVTEDVTHCLAGYINGKYNNHRSFWEIEKSFNSKVEAEAYFKNHTGCEHKQIVTILWDTVSEMDRCYYHMKTIGHFR